MTILLVGVLPSLADKIKKIFTGIEFKQITTSDEFVEKLDSISNQTAELIIASRGFEIPPNELAQSLRVQAQDVQIFYVSPEGSMEDGYDLKKNGFDEVFLLPFDNLELERALRRVKEALTGISDQVYTSVPLMDLEPEKEVEFEVSVFLPLNNKYVKVIRKGDKFRKEQAERLEKHAVNSVFVDEKDLKKFYEYTAQRLKSLRELSKTSKEGQAKLQESVRKIFHEVFSPKANSFETGKEILENGQKIIAELVGTPKVFDLHKELSRKMGASADDAYTKSVRISTYAGIFALATGHCAPEDAAIAALFMDMGLATIPAEIQNKPVSQMSPEEFSAFKIHPEKSAYLLKEKRIALVPTVQDGIIQHHERADGKGFPKGLTGSKICPVAQILRLSEQFDDFTVVRPGQKRCTPEEAIEKIIADGAIARDLVSQVKIVLVSGAKSA